eukprot:scaffold38010_cov105-Skeletonema_marinoi.AAC.1
MCLHLFLFDVKRTKPNSRLNYVGIQQSYSQREIRYGGRVALAAVPNWASSGHLRRCSDADTSNKYLSRVKDASILSWPTIMGH